MTLLTRLLAVAAFLPAKARDLVVRALAAIPVLVRSVPAWGAAAQTVLATVATTVVPLLPVTWQIKVAAVLAAATGWITALVKVVSNMTRVPAEARGLKVPEGKQLVVDVVPPPRPADYVTP